MFRHKLIELSHLHRNVLPSLFTAQLISIISLLGAMYSLSSYLSALLLEHTAANPSHLWMLIAFTFIRSFSTSWEQRTSIKLGIDSERESRRLLFNKLLENKQEISSTQFSSLYTKACEQFGEYSRIYLPASIKAFLTPLLILIFVLYTDWICGLILGVFLPIVGIFLMLTGKLGLKERQKKWSELSNLRVVLLDRIRGLSTTRQLNAPDIIHQQVAKTASQFKEITFQVLKTVFLSSLCLELASTISTAMLAVQAGIRLTNNLMEYQPALIVLLLAPEFFKALREYGAARHASMEADEALKMWQGSTTRNEKEYIPPLISESKLDEVDIKPTSFSKRLQSMLPGIILAVFLAIASPLAQAGLMMCSGILLSLCALNRPISSLHVIIAGVRFFGLARAALRYFERIQTHKIALSLFAEIRLHILEFLLKLPSHKLKKLHSGTLIRGLDQDMSELDNFLPKVLFPLLTTFSLTVILPLIPPLSGVPVLYSVLTLLWTMIIATLFYWKFIPSMALSDKLDYIAIEAAQSKKLILSCPNHQIVQSLEEETSKIYTHKALHFKRIGDLQSFIPFLFLGGIIVTLLFPLSTDNQFSAYLISASLFGLLALGEHYAALPVAIGQWKQSFTALERIYTIQNNKHANASSLPDLDSGFDISIKNLSYSYPDTDRTILKDLNITIKKGSFVAIHGSVGCGKTTLLEMLTGFLPSPKESIFFKEIDISEHNPMNLATLFSYCSQKGHIFSGTLRENLAIAAASTSKENSKKIPSISDKEMISMLSLVGLDMDYKFSLDMILGENAAILSGGERQRILLARTFLQNRSTILLDEPFNNLDTETQNRIIRYLKEQKGKKTLIMVSHQRNGFEIMDQIIKIPSTSESLTNP